VIGERNKLHFGTFQGESTSGEPVISNIIVCLQCVLHVGPGRAGSKNKAIIHVEAKGSICPVLGEKEKGAV